MMPFLVYSAKNISRRVLGMKKLLMLMIKSHGYMFNMFLVRSSIMTPI